MNNVSAYFTYECAYVSMCCTFSLLSVIICTVLDVVYV